jgi:hypothetical protein
LSSGNHHLHPGLWPGADKEGIPWREGVAGGRVPVTRITVTGIAGTFKTGGGDGVVCKKKAALYIHSDKDFQQGRENSGYAVVSAGYLIMTQERSRKSAVSVALSEILYSDMDTPLGIATLLLFVVCFLDVLTTTLILSSGGAEMNPVMVQIVAIPEVHMVFKWFVVAFVAGVSAIAERMIPRAGIFMTGVVILWYAFVVTHNIIVLAGLPFI